MKSNNIRSTFFWFLDIFKGRAISSHFKDIDNIFTNYQTKAIQQKLKNRLSNLLKHASTSTNFYSKYDPLTGIKSFPVINKTLVKEHLSEFRSKLFPDISNLFPMITSGSTGTPFKIFHDKNKRLRNSADAIYFASKAGYSLGEKLYYFKIWSIYNKKSSLQEFMQHIIPVEALNLERTSPEILRKIQKEHSQIHFLGYVSAFETLCKVMDKHPYLIPDVKVKSIITMSESLDNYTKVSGEKYFSCPVLSRYSNIENGILAQQTLENQFDFLVNAASYLIEIFDINTDTPLTYGQTGRIVVTDYLNFATPMIRYDTGDIGALEEKVVAGKTQLFLTNLEGRRLDQIFNTSGDLVSSYIVYKNMWKYTEIDQYQLIQKERKEYAFKICSSVPFEREQELKNEFKEYLGIDSIFNIEYVQEIPLLASGKRKKVINMMNTAN